ncbi:c-type cytochrome [Nitriliruptor alkaliphilus]|uniref:c-type cytochrome n=1 Tax=Nitriliruptor alkaliphilus TaxID=427918 RepID=UPI0006983123|nr:cytochrome c [Nitriliruptor alkaliphilus]
MRRLVRRTALAVLAVAALAACEGGTGDDGAGGRAAADVDVDRGAELFAANCAVCHGDAADGTAAGPPLVHEIYEPSHHSDAAFLIAVQRGVQPHHWDFGPMPPISGLDAADVADITAWVRERQREAGIE